MSRSSLLAQDHVFVKRKRREKLRWLFIAQSAIIPGLKKLNKASVPEDGIKYMKELKERVKALEEGLTMNSMVSVKISRPESDDGKSESPILPFDGFDRRFPEVVARVSEKHVLLRMHCGKHQGFILNILKEIEKLNLTILNHSVLPFGNSIVDVTVVAKMDVNFSSTIEISPEIYI